MSTSNWSNPLAPGYNPLATNPLNPLAGPSNSTASSSVPKKGPSTPVVAKLEEQLEPPTEFVNEYLKALCTSSDMSAEISKFESSKIRLKNKAIQIIRVLN